jgi:hypothetical protein
MNIDEAGGNYSASGVNYASTAGGINLANPGNGAVFDEDGCGFARCIEQPAIGYKEFL